MYVYDSLRLRLRTANEFAVLQYKICHYAIMVIMVLLSFMKWKNSIKNNNIWMRMLSAERARCPGPFAANRVKAGNFERRRMGPNRTKLACHQSKFNRDNTEQSELAANGNWHRRRSWWRLHIKQFHFCIYKYMCECLRSTQCHLCGKPWAARALEWQRTYEYQEL